MRKHMTWLRIVVLMVMCITFSVGVGTGTARLGESASSAAAKTSPVALLGQDPYGSIDTTRVREGFRNLGMPDVPENVIATLSTLRKVADYPIYTMSYFGPYIRASELQATYGSQATRPEGAPAWGCSLFAALGDAGRPLFGRNFDWEYSPILIVFLEPEDGYRSVVSVDLAYLVDEDVVGRLDTATLEEILPLLSAPFLSFDGMNERGVAIGMASVDYECGYPADPDKRNVGDLRLMREVLEAAATVKEAVEFLETVNPTSQGGPNMHYLVADRTPDAALIEYHDGKMYVFRSTGEAPWQLGTNFPVVLTQGHPEGSCWRYDRIEQTLRGGGGVLSPEAAMDLLHTVSTSMTQWSIAYDLADLTMSLVVGRQYDVPYTFLPDWADAQGE